MSSQRVRRPPSAYRPQWTTFCRRSARLQTSRLSQKVIQQAAEVCQCLRDVQNNARLISNVWSHSQDSLQIQTEYRHQNMFVPTSGIHRPRIKRNNSNGASANVKRVRRGQLQDQRNALHDLRSVNSRRRNVRLLSLSRTRNVDLPQEPET